MDCWKATEHKREVHNAIFKREKTDITINSPKDSIGKSDGSL